MDAIVAVAFGFFGAVLVLLWWIWQEIEISNLKFAAMLAELQHMHEALEAIRQDLDDA